MFPRYNNVIMEDFTESGHKEFFPEQDFRESSYEKYVLKKGLEGKPCVDKSLWTTLHLCFESRRIIANA